MARKFDYRRIEATAKNLIQRFGAKAKISGFIDVPNPTQPNRPGERQIVEKEITCVFLNYEEKHIDGELIKRGDMKVLMSPGEVQNWPQLTGVITRLDPAEKWSIVKIKPLIPGSTKLLYTVQVRQ